MKNIGLINKLANLYGQLTALAQAATKELEQKQFDKIKSIHQNFLSINNDVSVNKIVNLFNDFNNTFNFLTDSFNPVIKHAIAPFKKEVYDIYEKIMLSKINEMHDRYLSVANLIDAENIDENIKTLISLMGDFNAAVISLNNLEDSSLKLIISPLYKDVSDMHKKVTDFYERMGKDIEDIKYDSPDEDEEYILSDEDLLYQLRNLEAEYLVLANDTYDTRVNEAISSLEDIYNESKIILSKIVKNKNKEAINVAKSIFDKISSIHSSFISEQEQVVKGPKAKKDPQADTILKQKERERIRGQFRNYRERYRRRLELISQLPEEEQKTYKDNLYKSIKKYQSSRKGQAALTKARTKQKIVRKEKSQVLKDDKNKKLYDKILKDLEKLRF